MSEHPSMKFNSHPPNSVFIKAVTITVSRRAWPAQLYSAVSRRTVQTGRGVGRRRNDGERLREREGGHRVWTRHQRIETVCSKTTEGLNFPERQLSLLRNLTRTCLTWAWVSTPARPSALNQFHIGHTENYSSDLFALCVLFSITVIGLYVIKTLIVVDSSGEEMFSECFVG